MPRGLDHIVHAVRDLDAAADSYRRLGFTVGARNRHPWGTHNYIVQFPGFFIELLTLAGSAQDQLHAQAHFPSKPITLVVGFAPGGPTDTSARVLAEKMKDELGAPVIVENRAGAGGQIAAQALKAAPADGSTYFISHDHTISILPLVVPKPAHQTGPQVKVAPPA